MFSKVMQQCRIVDRQNLAVGKFDIDHEGIDTGIEGREAGRFSQRLGKVGGLGRSHGIPEAGTKEQHATLFPRRQPGKSGARLITAENSDPVTVDAGKPQPGPFQFFARHALDRIAPQAFDTTDHAHRFPPCSTCRVCHCGTVHVSTVCSMHVLTGRACMV